MKWLWPLAALGLLVALLCFRPPPAAVRANVPTSHEPKATLRDTPSARPPAIPPVTNLPPNTPVIPPDSAAKGTPPLSPAAPEYSDLPPAVVLENTRRAIRSYASMFGGNPVGTNPEITKALNGGNPKQVHFIRPDAGMRINGKGELIDPWGTPYFFHQLSGQEMEIHSAGPDRILWTPDDLVIK